MGVGHSDKPAEVWVWTARPEEQTDPERLSEYRGFLDAAELARHARFHFAKDAHLYLVSHALVRIALSRHFPLSPAEWQFTHTPLGRPEIQRPAGCPNLTFSMSHCDGLVACAIADDLEIGIDVEPLRRHADWRSIAARQFAETEVAELETLDDGGHTRRFLQLWTLKEAYLKARGLGLSSPLSGCAFKIDQTTIEATFSEALCDDPQNWTFLTETPSKHHILSLAVKDRGAGLLLIKRDLEQEA